METEAKKDIINNADERWWQEFYKLTDNLKKPVLLDHFSEEVLFSEKEVIRLLNDVSKLNDGLSCLRVFVDGNPRKEYDIKVFLNPPGEQESLEDWFKKMFGDQKFGIVVNDIEQFDDTYTQKFARFIHPMLEKTGIPEAGLDMFIFIGNYTHTPFGVHQDSDVTQLFHFQFGPCDKDFSVWEPEAFIEKTGSHYQSHDIETLIPIGQTFNLKPNSLFFMPGRLYHIGSNTGLTIAMSLAFNKVSSKALLYNVLGASNDHLILSSTYQKDLREVATLSAEEIVNPLFRDTKMAEWLNFSLNAFRLTLKSNAGFATSPLSANMPKEISACAVAMPRPYQIYLLEAGEHHKFIFARGYRIMVKAISDLSDFIEELNSFRPIPVSELQDSFFINWEGGYGVTLLKFLISRKALSLVPRDENITFNNC